MLPHGRVQHRAIHAMSTQRNSLLTMSNRLENGIKV
jgi:hypothetical protein